MILQKYKLNISIKYYQIKECIKILNVVLNVIPNVVLNVVPNVVINVVPNVVIDVVLNVGLLWDCKL